MFKIVSKVIFILLPLILSTGAATLVFAAPVKQTVACEQDYSVQADDWLSKLADKFYGDILAYPAIVEATNVAAQADGSYATITNPDLIEIGWKICVPSAADAQALMGGQMAVGEKTTFSVRIENIGDFKFKSSSLFNTPTGATEPGPLLPGGVYEFAFSAAPGDRLSLATMLVHSNDWFIGPGQAGIALFNEDGSPVGGEVTDQIQIWDAGTEINQEPALGADQPLQQAGPNTGVVDSDNTVRVATDAQPTVLSCELKIFPMRARCLLQMATPIPPPLRRACGWSILTQVLYSPRVRLILGKGWKPWLKMVIRPV
jgi:hypothetical protein